METPDNAQQPIRRTMNRSSFYMLLFLFSLLFFNFSDNGSVLNGKLTREDLLAGLKRERELLANVTFNTNVSNPLPDQAKEAVYDLRAIQGNGTSHYYHNISSIFRGEWSNTNLRIPDTINRTLVEEARKEFDFGGVGTFSLNLKSTATQNEDINYLQGYIRLKDAEKSDYGALLLTGGVHFLGNGSIYLMVVPEGFPIALDELLHMMPNNESMVETQKVLDAEVEKRIDELNKSAYWEWQSVGEGNHSASASFNCEFQMYAQLHPVSSNIKMSELLEYEKELENAQGLSTIDPPPLFLSSQLYSPNCQLLLSSSKEPGIKIEIYYNKAISYAGLATIIAVIQIFSLIHQMEFTPTPSSVSNVSYWTIAMQAAMDGYLCLLHLTTGVVIDNVFLPFATAAFFTFILVSIFGMRYLLVVWRIQRPESIRAQSQPASPAPEPSDESNQTRANNNNNDTSTDTLLPLANRPAVNRPSTTEESNPQRDVTYLYYRLYAVLLFGLFLFYQSITRSAFVQNIIIGTLGFAFYSYWIPQIVRNVLRGCRHPLSHRYILIMSITRLSVPLYFYGCPENLIGHETTKWVWALVGYVALQVAVLFLQDQFGPRFFVPSRYLPQTYNYHPILQDDQDEEEEEEEHQDRHKRRDCAICFLPVDSTNTSYMVTPCHHIFHTDCLQKWMQIKLECPVCRAYLPSY